METTRAGGAPVDADVQKAVRMAIAATEKKDYQTALTLFHHLYEGSEVVAPADGLSHYGLCVAVHEKHTKKGIDLCREAISQQFYDSTHHANLVRLHLAKGNRRFAVQALDEALKSLPGDERLVQLRGEMGFRHRNPVPFLPRESTFNRILGPGRRGKGTRDSAPESRSFEATSFNMQQMQPLQMILFGLFGFATIFSITFYILYQRAYG
jgi:tetratricopeptide (TPR) repeat protein